MYQLCTDVECDWLLIDAHWKKFYAASSKVLCAVCSSHSECYGSIVKWPSDSAVLGWISPQEANWKRWIGSCMLLLLLPTARGWTVGELNHYSWHAIAEGLEVKLYPRFSSMAIVYSMFASLLCPKCKLLLSCSATTRWDQHGNTPILNQNIIERTRTNHYLMIHVITCLVGIGRKGMATYQDLCDHVFSYAILATRILGVHPKEFLIFGFDLGLFP